MLSEAINAASAAQFLLTVTSSNGTVFKQTTEDSTVLPAELKYRLPANAFIGVRAFREVEDNHFLVTLSFDLGCPTRYNTWYVFRPHVSIRKI